jgi:hypothetical protein
VTVLRPPATFLAWNTCSLHRDAQVRRGKTGWYVLPWLSSILAGPLLFHTTTTTIRLPAVLARANVTLFRRPRVISFDRACRNVGVAAAAGTSRGMVARMPAMSRVARRAARTRLPAVV